MAQPPDINETFVREVEENLRRDQMRDFAKKYGGWLIGAVVLFLAASGGWIYWQYRQDQRSEQQVEQLAEVYKDIAAGKTASVPQKLDELAESSSDAVRASGDPETPPAAPGATLHEVRTGRLRGDGNTVDVDREMLNLSRTAGFYQTSVELLRKYVGILRAAITEGRG